MPKKVLISRADELLIVGATKLIGRVANDKYESAVERKGDNWVSKVMDWSPTTINADICSHDNFQT